MASTTHTTSMANKATVQQEWLLVDAENEVLGRLASKVAMLVRGKHKSTFTPHVNCGDHVVVINADKVRLTGRKMADKEYQRYSGYPGGRRVETAGKLLARKPEALVESAVRGMLPKNRLGRRLFGNLHVVAGEAHKHEAQKPRTIDLNTIK
ncbi:MAG: 50S ribosomal protein L13 [Flavobacteriales bacterium]|nr:50S ribosomal protein L13 [Flavobacteriales bacterium]MCB0788000.1 50S ribosomal protein L13 [Flavobacteriales bacterium]MCB0808315.1 50S ribosomal protein L13 [Flavobacteriales bacterium]MCB0814086.1 50S ribosomal protein L13 [Flavobacteriales bacterium]MCB0818057.1 50S ribosomal protein L13 [Flavobacteriales bacterium]